MSRRILVDKPRLAIMWWGLWWRRCDPPLPLKYAFDFRSFLGEHGHEVTLGPLVICWLAPWWPYPAQPEGPA